MNQLHTRFFALAAGATLLSGAAFAQGGDDCSVPTAINATGAYAFDTTVATTSGFDGGATCGFGSDTINQDLFWAFTVPVAGDYVFDTFGTSFDTKLSVHAGGDCNATCLDYNDDTNGLQSEVEVLGANVGDVILVQVGGFGTNAGTGTLNITQFIPPPVPANDDCSTATAINTTGSFAFDTTSATTSGFDGGSGGVGCYNDINQDVFWAWTAPAAGDYIIDTETSSFDTKVNVSTGGDCNATCLDSDDDGGTGLLSSVTVAGVNAGDVLLIQVGGFGTASGPGSMNIALDPCGALVPDGFEPNDSCAGAAALGDGLYTGLNVAKTNGDFYNFTVADGATLDASIFFLQANADTDLYLWEAGVCVDDLADLGTGALAAGISTTDNETISWTNTTGADVDCVLRVNVWPGSTGDCTDYDLDVSGAGPGGPTLFCDPANTNSSGNSVTLANSSFTGPGLVHLEAEGGPNAQFGYFLVSATFSDPGVPVSQGVICVGAPQGRYNGVSGANSVGQFDAGGVFQNISGTSTVGSGFDVPASLPNPPGGVIVSGDTYHFQLWYRDGPNSNFSNGISVVFP